MQRGTTSVLKRRLFAAAGWAMVALGVVGLFLPVMPTTVFMILAAWLFSRSSPRFEAWLLAHPVFGPPIVKWRENGAIPPAAKALAVIGMAGGFGVFYLLLRPPLWLAGCVAAALLASAGFVLSRPSR